LLDFLDHAVDQRFLRKEHRQMVLVAQTPGQLLSEMEAYHPLKIEKWIDRK